MFYMLRSLEECGMVYTVLEMIHPTPFLHLTVREDLRKFSGINMISTVACVISVGQRCDPKRIWNFRQLYSAGQDKNTS
jgi:hypothetical protein